MKAHIHAQHKKYLIFLALIIPINVLVTFFFYVIAPSIVKTSLPMVTSIIQRSYHETELTNIEYSDRSGRRVIGYTMKITKWIKGIDIPLVDYLNNSLYISSQFITAIIFYTLLFSWPFMSMRRRLMAAAFFIPFVLLFIFMDISFSTVTSIELECQRKLPGYTIQKSMQGKTMIFLGHFFNNGGRQFLGVLLFLLSAVPFHRSSARKMDSNAPTPARAALKRSQGTAL